MSKSFIITGTDTGIGKTVFSAALVRVLDGNYWKPIQSGIEGVVDTKTVQNLTGFPDERFLPESYVLTQPLSPHRAAELDDIEIDMSRINIPVSERPLVIEGAGGLMVPVTRKNLQVNMFKRWNLPIILCARTGLGTINHTLLSLEAMWARGMNVHGIAFIGEENTDNMETIAQLSGTRVLGRLPILAELNEANLHKAFTESFRVGDFT